MVPQKMGDRATKYINCMPLSHAHQQIRLGKKIVSIILPPRSLRQLSKRLKLLAYKQQIRPLQFA